MERVPTLEILTVVIMLALGGFCLWRGLFRGSVLFFNVVAAGFLTFNFFEIVANGLDWLTGPGAHADALSITPLFFLFFVPLAIITKRIAPGDLSLPSWVKRLGGAGLGVATGYFVAGMLICVLQTLPLDRHFMGYDAENGIGLGSPDRVWLAVVHRGSGQVFDRLNETWFDADGSFIPRYARYRRTGTGATGPENNQGEFPEVQAARKSLSGP